MSVYILDLDGPILDGKRRHFACYRDILKAHGKTPLDIETYWSLKRAACPTADILARGDAGDIYPVFKAAWLEQIERPEYLALDGVQPGAIAALARWRGQGHSCVLVTLRQNPEALQNQLKALALRDYFDAVLVTQSAQKEQAITDHYPYFKPDEALWVGDTEVDAKSALRLGCRCYLVGNGVRSPQFLAGFEGASVVAAIGDVP